MSVDSTRATGPPRSSSQYQSPKISTLVTHSTTPERISGWPPALPPFSRKCTSSSSETRFATLTRPIREIAKWRRTGEYCIAGFGIEATSPMARTPSSVGSSHVGPMVSFSGSAR